MSARVDGRAAIHKRAQSAKCDPGRGAGGESGLGRRPLPWFPRGFSGRRRSDRRLSGPEEVGGKGGGFSCYTGFESSFENRSVAEGEGDAGIHLLSGGGRLSILSQFGGGGASPPPPPQLLQEVSIVVFSYLCTCSV